MGAQVFRASQSATHATALLLLLAGVMFGSLFSAREARAEASPSVCENALQVAVLPAPLAPRKGAPLQVLFVAEKPLDGALSLIMPDGSVAAKSDDRHGGPPYFWYVEVASPTAGTWLATLTLANPAAGCSTITRNIVVRNDRPPPPRATGGSIWPLRSTWSRATEDLYSAWIQKLFDAPLDQEPSWTSLHEILRDRSRNILFNYLGLNEDKLLILRPDCAKLPYLLRAYFSFKMGLPFGYSKCTRGNTGKPPKCNGWFNTEEGATHPVQSTATASPRLFQQIFSQPAAAVPSEAGPPASPAAPKQLGLVATFPNFLQTVSAAVQSGNGRTSAADSNTDFYPVSLSQDTLRPGTIYADPYGHILMLVRRVPQSGGKTGMFLAADAEPDGTIARKRYWRGNFLFVHDPALGGPGFKRFRPIVREKNGTMHRLTNSEIAKDTQYGDFSLQQSQLSERDFYDRMDDVMSPEPLDPVAAMEDAISSLEEQVKLRITSVDNGEKYETSGHGTVNMPNGPAIFETSGAWEDYSTPARDFRLLIAIDVVRGFPDRVVRRPQRFLIPVGRTAAEVKAQLQGVLASELPNRKFSYTRSDGSTWTLSLKDAIDRAGALEMAYNPNDCVELRWGAPANSQEASTCKRQAPAAQRAKMMKYRSWFQERRWPTRA